MFRHPLRRRKRAVIIVLVLLCLVATGLAVRPLRVRHHLGQAQEALAERNADAALVALQEARRLDPQNAATAFWTARAYRRAGQLDRVEESLKDAERWGYSAEKVRQERWLTLAQAGQVQEVERYLPALLADAGEDGAEICEAFVNGYTLSLRFAAARHLLDAWQADFPEDPEPHFRQGFLWQATTEWQKAADAYQKGLALAPERTDARLRLAVCLLKMNKLQEALPEFAQVLENWPDNLEALDGMGHCQAEMSDLSEARMTFHRVLKLDPQHFEARLVLARLELAERRPVAALEWLEPLADKWPLDTALRHLLAQAYSAVGDEEKAEESFAIVAESEKALDRLEALFDAVSKTPDDVAVRYEIGYLLLHHRSRPEGAGWLESVLRIDPRHQGARRELADYYAKSGDERTAGEHRRWLLSHVEGDR